MNPLPPRMPAATAFAAEVAHSVFSCPSIDLYGLCWRDATVEPKCIGKCRIRHVHFRVAYRDESHVGQLARTGGHFSAAKDDTLRLADGGNEEVRFPLCPSGACIKGIYRN